MSPVTSRLGQDLMAVALGPAKRGKRLRAGGKARMKGTPRGEPPVGVTTRRKKKDKKMRVA